MVKKNISLFISLYYTEIETKKSQFHKNFVLPPGHVKNTLHFGMTSKPQKEP